MPFPIARDAAHARRPILIWLALLFVLRPVVGRTDEPESAAPVEPAAKAPVVAKPAKELAGALAHVRAARQRGDKSDLLNQIDTARDVVYTTDTNPKPAAEQYQFAAAGLRTPETGDARLVLPVEAAKFYELSVRYRSDAPDEPRSIGLGLMLGGHQFFLDVPATPATLGRYLNRRAARQSPNPAEAVDQPAPPAKGGELARPKAEVVRVLVGEDGFLLHHFGKIVEWAGPARLLSLEPAWAVSATDKVFLAFPDGQVDILGIELKPLDRDGWLSQVRQLKPQGTIVRRIAEADQPTIAATVEPLPQLARLEPTFRRLAWEGNFDELDRWAERFRRGDVVDSYEFASETFYSMVSSSFLSRPHPQFMLDFFWQRQLAFADAWIEHAPDSVAARIVKARTWLGYAWNARGGGTADTVTEEGWRLFGKRIALAEDVLLDAARKPTADSCIYSALLTVGMARSWEHDRLEETLAKGMKISSKNYKLYNAMVQALLPRWGGESGEIGKFANTVLERVKGDEGLIIYARIAAELRDWNEDLTGLSLDTLRAALPVTLKRYGQSFYYKNVLCWLACNVDDRETAKALFPEIEGDPDMSVWKSRAELDNWRRWSDPALAGASEFLPPTGEETAHLQAYSGEEVLVQFLADSRTLVTASVQLGSPFKLWDLRAQKLSKTIDIRHAQWSTHELRRLSDDGLLAGIWTGERLVCVHRSAPAYAAGAFFKIRGLDIVQVSDDFLTGASVADELVTVVRKNSRQQAAIRAPKLREIALSRDGKHLLTQGEAFQLWDATSGERLAMIDAAPTFFTFLEDHSGLVYFTKDQLVVRDLAKNQERLSLALADPAEVRTVASSQDGRWLATAGLRAGADGTKREAVVLWSLDRTEPIHVFQGHQQPLRRIAFSPDGKLLASGSADGVVKVWNVEQAATPGDAPPPQAASDAADGKTGQAGTAGKN